MARIEDHALLDEESGVEQIRPRQGTKLMRVCASVVGCMALVGGGYLAGRRATLSSESLGHFIGEVGVPQTVEEAKQLYTQTTKDMTLAEKAKTNSGILGKLPAPTNEDVKLLATWYDTGAASGDQSVMQQFLYDALIAAAAPAPAAPKTVAAPARSYQEFGYQYSQETAGKPWQQIMKIDELVRDAVVPVGASPAVQQLNHWYRHHATAEEKHNFDNDAVQHMKLGAQ